MPDQQYYLHARLDRAVDPVRVDVAIKLPSPSAPAQLDQVVALPAPLKPVRLTQYLPQARLEQTVVPDDTSGAPPAIRLSVDGPTQSHQRWLVANDVERNRLISLIATWRYMSVADREQRDDLFKQFENEFTRTPMLAITRNDGSGSQTLPAKPGASRALDDLECTVRVKRFYPDFAVDGETKKPTNKSDRRFNPAALLEIEHKGAKEERWVFARFPQFSEHGSTNSPIRVTLDCPAESRSGIADFALVTIGGAGNEIWVKQKGTTTSKPLALDARMKVPETQYTFHIADFVPTGRLIEEYRPAEGRGGVPALQFKTVDRSEKEMTMWLTLDKQRIVPTVLGPLTVGFGPRPTGAHGVQP
jgi:hypothetical protein